MSVLAAIICWFRGHRWRVLRASCHVVTAEQERARRLGRPADPMVGVIAKCVRCECRHFDECMSCELSARSPELVAEIGP